MHILVTGGTGVIGKAAVDELLGRGHTVRLFTRNAEHDSEVWAEGVEPRNGSITEEADVRGSAEGCDAVLHIVGIIEESGELTFESINVGGTRAMVREAERAGVRRFLYISSLGADTGESGYHRSKREAEAIVSAYTREWLILRPGNVYGPGDEVISTLLKMVRTLPAVPVISSGDHPFQPVWTGDLAKAIALAVERDDLANEVLELAGDEQISMDDLVEMLKEVTGKESMRLPVPEWLARIGTGAAESIGIHLPVNSDQLTMLREGNTIDPPRKNALTETLGIEPIPLREGLKELAGTLPVQLSEEGWGALKRHRYWADIHGSRYTASQLFELFRMHFGEFLPEPLLSAGAEPDTPESLELGATLSLAIPLRGTVQVRVAEIDRCSVSCTTIEGHLLAGAIRFIVREHGDAIRFEVRSYTRAASLVDMVGMATVGRPLQRATWVAVVEEGVERSGGEAADGVQTTTDDLRDGLAARVERWNEQITVQLEKDGKE